MSAGNESLVADLTHGVMVQAETIATYTANLADLERKFPRNAGEELKPYLLRAWRHGPGELFDMTDEPSDLDAYVLLGGEWVPAAGAVPGETQQ